MTDSPDVPRLAIASLLLLSAAGCVTPGGEIFSDPSRFEGRTVRLCGYFRDRFEDRNIWRSEAAYRRRDEDGGIGLLPARPLNEPSDLDGRNACIRAVIVRTGCTVESICSWSYFPWAATEVAAARIGPGAR